MRMVLTVKSASAEVNRDVSLEFKTLALQVDESLSRERPHRASVLLGERLDDRVGDRVGVLVKHEVAAVEIAQFGGRHNLLHEFGGRWHDERVISPPDDERLRLPVLQIGVPFRVGLDVRREVINNLDMKTRF